MGRSPVRSPDRRLRRRPKKVQVERWHSGGGGRWSR
ncbi:hypothetical protein ERO13_A13G171850v2 [Gossypium hirsutum]|uniref:Uncharacterized protein n=1 Tax=Gossypium tomentosum TaxID=34277 RepID=A0A5D2MMQ0_GOSTO|nr:hypothetical protein ERO13_A13G171850v2 [Gossypium hirsutum]TYH92797.1 hypothetical protein ES332_A13G208500v1 [Gossypium tomentosum]